MLPNQNSNFPPGSNQAAPDFLNLAQLDPSLPAAYQPTVPGLLSQPAYPFVLATDHTQNMLGQESSIAALPTGGPEHISAQSVLNRLSQYQTWDRLMATTVLTSAAPLAPQPGLLADQQQVQELLLHAQDNPFRHLLPLAGLPEYSPYAAASNLPLDPFVVASLFQSFSAQPSAANFNLAANVSQNILGQGSSNAALPTTGPGSILAQTVLNRLSQYQTWARLMATTVPTSDAPLAQPGLLAEQQQLQELLRYAQSIPALADWAPALGLQTAEATPPASADDAPSAPLSAADTINDDPADLEWPIIDITEAGQEHEEAVNEMPEESRRQIQIKKEEESDDEDEAGPSTSSRPIAQPLPSSIAGPAPVFSPLSDLPMSAQESSAVFQFPPVAAPFYAGPFSSMPSSSPSMAVPLNGPSTTAAAAPTPLNQDQQRAPNAVAPNAVTQNAVTQNAVAPNAVAPNAGGRPPKICYLDCVKMDVDVNNEKCTLGNNCIAHIYRKKNVDLQHTECRNKCKHWFHLYCLRRTNIQYSNGKPSCCGTVWKDVERARAGLSQPIRARRKLPY